MVDEDLQLITREQLEDKVKQFTNFSVKETFGYNADYMKVPFTNILYGDRVLFTISDVVANNIQISSLDTKHAYEGVFTQVLSYATQYALTPILDRHLEPQVTITTDDKGNPIVDSVKNVFNDWASQSKDDHQTTVDQKKEDK